MLVDGLVRRILVSVAPHWKTKFSENAHSSTWIWKNQEMSPPLKMKLWVRGARQIVHVANRGQRFLTKEDMKSLAITQGPEGLSIIVDERGLIKEMGSDSVLSSKYTEADFEEVLDARGKCILPGFVDGHTHPVWAGDRVHEFAMKLAGASYMEVHEAGGGINFTVERTRDATEEELLELLEERLWRMLKAGTTTVECKSGYGLNTETEIKMLRVLERARDRVPIEISSTFLGAHSVPKGVTPEAATSDVISRQLAAVVRMNEAGELNVENVDVFCETGVFSVDQSRRILEAGKEAGLRINFHGEELSQIGGAEMGASLGATAISHLEEISDAGIAAMAKSGSTAVILPTTAYILRLPSPPVRKMIDNGVIVALGTDFNPNAFCLTMPPVMHLACVNLRMSLGEALAASTLNAAHSIGRSHTHGSLEEGKVADFIVVDAPRWEHLVYQFAGHDHVIQYVTKRGKIVYKRKQ